MKRLLQKFMMLTLLFVVQQAVGQEQGIITYENKVNLHRRLSAEQEGMKSMLPEYRTNKMQLAFNAQESLYTPVYEDEPEAAGGGGMSVRFQVASAEIYTSRADARRTSLLEFMGKTYLIQDSLQILPWKFGSETKTVQGYACKRAYYQDEERKQLVTAWYTEDLRPFLGPESYNSLPGTVLEVDINAGERVLKALKVELRPLKKHELVEPKKGRLVSREAYNAMVEEQRKQMEQSGGRVMIRN
ncbi:MAG: GLPGLI family protein [Hymenobacteraceae bacterium]|nr:GLPGLI family protein [Hymenobacteraceae bacterium]